jgi:RHS repeat-associated protein
MYDGLNAVQELIGSTPSANILPGLHLDEWFARADSAGSRNLLTDAIGSTVALTDAAGAVQTEYTYEPFGGTATSGASNASLLQFAGRENDCTGLFYYRARFYSPTLQRFISEDPIEYAGGLNLHAYTNNNPVNATDPLGLEVVLFGRIPGWIQNPRLRGPGTRILRPTPRPVPRPAPWRPPTWEELARSPNPLRRPAFLERLSDAVEGLADLLGDLFTPPPLGGRKSAPSPCTADTPAGVECVT